MELLLAVGVPLLLLIVGGGLGRIAEHRHEESLRDREQAMAGLRVDDVDVPVSRADPARGAVLVVAEVVVASDYFKSFAASLRTLVGGETRSFARLLLRARREAVARLMEQTSEQGYDGLCNVRLTTAQIGQMMVAVQASGTAYGRAPGRS